MLRLNQFQTISHRLDDVLLVSDTVTILRDGQIVTTAGADSLSTASMMEQMSERIQGTGGKVSGSAIAAAVIGGTSLIGGRGSIIGAFAGVLIIATLQNGLAQIGVTEPSKPLITGAVIIIAVLIDRWRSQYKVG